MASGFNSTAFNTGLLNGINNGFKERAKEDAKHKEWQDRAAFDATIEAKKQSAKDAKDAQDQIDRTEAIAGMLTEDGTPNEVAIKTAHQYLSVNKGQLDMNHLGYLQDAYKKNKAQQSKLQTPMAPASATPQTAEQLTQVPGAVPPIAFPNANDYSYVQKATNAQTTEEHKQQEKEASVAANRQKFEAIATAMGMSDDVPAAIQKFANGTADVKDAQGNVIGSAPERAMASSYLKELGIQKPHALSETDKLMEMVKGKKSNAGAAPIMGSRQPQSAQPVQAPAQPQPVPTTQNSQQIPASQLQPNAPIPQQPAASTQQQQAPAVQQPVPGQHVPEVTGKDDPVYRSLPSGSLFKTPDGKTRVK